MTKKMEEHFTAITKSVNTLGRQGQTRGSAIARSRRWARTQAFTAEVIDTAPTLLRHAPTLLRHLRHSDTSGLKQPHRLLALLGARADQLFVDPAIEHDGKLLWSVFRFHYVGSE